jgi:hypothetical protein
MSTNHCYQVMLDPSPEDRAALEASIAADGVLVPIDIDEEGNILDGHQRQEICDELGRECPKRVITGLTEAQKIEYAWQVNVARRQLSQAQKRQLAEKLWHDGQTQECIAQLLAVSQSTIANWVSEFINSDKLPHSPTVQGKDGKQYPRTKTRRRTTHPTEEADRPETPQIPSVTSDGPAQAPEQQEPSQPRDTPAEAQSLDTEPPIASDVPDAPETPPLISDELQIEARQRASLPLGSSPVLSAENDAEAHWVDALQDLSAKLEMLQVQGSLLPGSTGWAPDTKARGMATIRHMKEMCIALEAVVGADMCETIDRNSHDDVDATPPPVLVPIADEAQEHGNGELVTMSSAEDPGEDVADGDHLPLQCDGEGKPPAAPSRPARAEDREDSPARTRTRRSKQAIANGQGSRAPEQMAQDHTTPDVSQNKGEAATMGHPAPQHDEEAIAPAADAERPSGVPVPTDHFDSTTVELTRCGWCHRTQFSFISKESGQIYCTCGSIYRLSSGLWEPGDRDKRQMLPVSAQATDCTMQDEIERGSGEATTSSIAGGHRGINGQ